MWSRRILIALIGLLAGLFDATISSWLPGSLGALRAALPLVILLAAFSSLERMLTAAVIAGIVLDALLPSFGLWTLRLMAVGCAVHLLSRVFVTNRSLLGVYALGLVGLLADRALLAVFVFGRSFGQAAFIPEMGAPIIPSAAWILAVMTVVFLLFAAFTKRFMPLVTRR